MFSLKKNQKSVFWKLYRYYCTKLLSKIWLVLFYMLLFVFLIVIQGASFRGLLNEKTNSWQWKLITFWLVSFFQLFLLMLAMGPLVSYLVGRDLGWSKLRKRQLFGLPKISREEDIKILLFTPSVERQTVIWAKFAAAFSYFMGINFLVTLFGFFFFLFFTNFGVTAAFGFILLNGGGLALVNFLLIVPVLFYQQEGGSFLVYLLFAVFVLSLSLTAFLFTNFIFQYPVIFLSASVPPSILAGYLFFSLYRKKFLKNDLVS